MLGIDPAFNGMAGKAHILLRERQWMTSRNADLFAHQINPGNGFGDGVFNLQSGVHLNEKELTIFKQEFHRANTKIAHFSGSLSRDGANFIAHFGCQCG